MDAGHASTAMDVYGLWFWPAPPAPDAIIRQTSAVAAYWHTEIARINQLHSRGIRGPALSAGPVFWNDP
jgi:hypothetical protein